MVARSFTVILESAEEGGFIAKCVELPVASQGDTRKKAIANVKEAIEGYLEVKAELLGKTAKGERVEVVVEAPSGEDRIGARVDPDGLIDGGARRKRRE